MSQFRSLRTHSTCANRRNGDKGDAIVLTVTPKVNVFDQGQGTVYLGPSRATTATVSNSAPTLINPDIQANFFDDFVELPVTASDPDGDILSFSAANLPAGLSIDPYLNVISGIIAQPAMAAVTVSVTIGVSDGEATASQQFPWLIVDAVYEEADNWLMGNDDELSGEMVVGTFFVAPDTTSAGQIQFFPFALVLSISSPEDPHLPGDDRGIWVEGTRGNGVFEYSNTPLNQERNLVGTRVRFANNQIAPGGFPAAWYYGGDAEISRVQIEQVRGTRADQNAADAAYRVRTGNSEWRRPEGYTWNHVGGDGNQMELILTERHGRIAHEATASGPRATARGARAARGATQALGVALAIATLLAVAEEAEAAPGQNGGLLSPTGPLSDPGTVLVVGAAGADLASIGAQAISFSARTVGADNAAVTWGARSTTYGNIGGKLGNAAMYFAIFSDGYQALRAAYDYDNPENWNNYLAQHQSNINNAALFWQGERWNGILDNPVMAFGGVVLNPIGTISATVVNVNAVGGDLPAIADIVRQTNQVQASNLNAMDYSIQQQQQFLQNQTWLQTASVEELQANREVQRGSLVSRLSYFAWAQAEYNKWWWERTASASHIAAEISRTQQQIELYQLQIDAIDAELERRGISPPSP